MNFYPTHGCGLSKDLTVGDPKPAVHVIGHILLLPPYQHLILSLCYGTELQMFFNCISLVEGVTTKNFKAWYTYTESFESFAGQVEFLSGLL